MSDSNKSSVLELYASNDLSVKALSLKAENGSLTADVGTDFQIRAGTIAISGSTNVSHDIDNLAETLYNDRQTATSKQVVQDAEISSLNGLVSAEVAARQAAVSNLQSQINAEVTRATAAESALNTKISVEQTTRAAADTDIQSRIDAEVAARQAAINGLDSSSGTALTNARTALENSVTSLNSRVDGILLDAPVEFDSLKEIYDAYSQSDTTISSSISSLSSSIATLTERFNLAFPEYVPPP